MGLSDSLGTAAGYLGRLMDWANDNWLALVLTVEIVGAVVAIKMRSYKRGILWLLIALATIWIKGIA